MSTARHHLLRPGAIAPAVLLAVLAVIAGVLPMLPGTRAADFSNRIPIGRIDNIWANPGGLWLRGWALDPDVGPQPVSLAVTVDGHVSRTAGASTPRADVGKAYPKSGPNHGYSFFAAVPEGKHTVCVVARNLGRGTSNYTLGCTTRTFDYGPQGHLNAVDTRPGAVHVKGWAVDDDAPTSPVTVDVTVDGARTTLVANRSRPDVAKAVKGVGALHGFEATIPAAQGKHTVCLTGRNLGTYGTANRFTCTTVTLNDSPMGHLDITAQSGTGLRVRGWGFDRDAATTPLTAVVTIDRTAHSVVAKGSRTDVAAAYPGVGAAHGFDQTFPVTEGTHSVCVALRNIGYGADGHFVCRQVPVHFTPTAAVTALSARPTGLAFRGWALDPDTKAALSVRLYLDNRLVRTVTANASGTTNTGHNFIGNLDATSGKRTVCAVALNAGAGSAPSATTCRSITLALAPLGAYEAATRSGNDIVVSGWTFDPDTTRPITVVYTVDGKAAATATASAARSDVGRVYSSAGSSHGFRTTLRTSDAEHTVCVTAKNVSGGRDVALGCRNVIAVHPVVPSAPRSVSATTTYGGATVRWAAPASDGGAPRTSYVVTASNGKAVTAAATATSATFTGLTAGGKYSFTVVARNVAGSSPAGRTAVVTVPVGPAPQTKPAPISTSRYLRNIRTCSASETSVLRSSGATDAKNNPSGHRYLMLLDIGGQSQTYGGVVLSATTRFVSYSALLACSKSYVDGYASQIKATAPATIAIGVNNDMDVNTQTGRDWATKIVNPLMTYAKKYTGITIAGANDVEPGFSASYAATRNWLSGYLGATSAKFVFNGSADGCAWTVTNRSCNNGWTMTGLYTLAAGLAPTRIITLPQVYNYTMADQWKYISLTGVGARQPRINFGGPLTEYTACVQARSCGSIGGVAAWNRMWSNLQSTPALRVSSLPFATDLRIDS